MADELDRIHNFNRSKSLRDELEWQRATAGDKVAMISDAIVLSIDPELNVQLAKVGRAHTAVVEAITAILERPK